MRARMTIVMRAHMTQIHLKVLRLHCHSQVGQVSHLGIGKIETFRIWMAGCIIYYLYYVRPVWFVYF